jgi:GNAT superfamily N-acetyltransferase
VTWKVEPLARRHDRSHFDCGNDALNGYLKQLASQHAKRNISKTYVAVRESCARVDGFYALSTGSMILENLPEATRARLPRYPIPTAHLGQLAIDKDVQGQGLGEALLLDALRRVARVSDELGIYAVTVDAIDERAKAFYERYGFVSILGDPLHLYLEIKVIHQLPESPSRPR